MQQAENGLPFRLDRDSNVPLTEQLVSEITGACAAGTLAVGQRLPGIREMAVILSISDIVVRRAIQQLAKSGVVVARPRMGIHIGDRARPAWKAHVVLVHLNEGPYAMYRQRSVQTVVSQADVRLTLHFCPDLKSAAARQRLHLLLESQRVDLVALVGGATELGNDIHSWGIKHISLGSKSSLPHALSSLIYNSQPAWAALGAHLWERGAHSIAVLPSQSAQSHVIRALLVSGLQRQVIQRSTSVGDGLEAVERRGFDEMSLLLQRPLPDAVVFTDDWTARGGLLALAAAGVCYPRDILVATLANRGFVPLGTCPLTRVETDPHQHGEVDAHHILFALGLKREAPPTTIGAALIIGASTIR